MPSIFLTGTKSYTHRYLSQTPPEEEEDTVEDAILRAQQVVKVADGDNGAEEDAP